MFSNQPQDHKNKNKKVDTQTPQTQSQTLGKTLFTSVANIL